MHAGKLLHPKYCSSSSREHANIGFQRFTTGDIFSNIITHDLSLGRTSQVYGRYNKIFCMVHIYIYIYSCYVWTENFSMHVQLIVHRFASYFLLIYASCKLNALGRIPYSAKIFAHTQRKLSITCSPVFLYPCPSLDYSSSSVYFQMLISL